MFKSPDLDAARSLWKRPTAKCQKLSISSKLSGFYQLIIGSLISHQNQFERGGGGFGEDMDQSAFSGSQNHANLIRVI